MRLASYLACWDEAAPILLVSAELLIASSYSAFARKFCGFVRGLAGAEGANQYSWIGRGHHF
jgi:hypothetical protein